MLLFVVAVVTTRGKRGEEEEFTAEAQSTQRCAEGRNGKSDVMFLV